jgi:hypothetical protein
MVPRQLPARPGRTVAHRSGAAEFRAELRASRRSATRCRSRVSTCRPVSSCGRRSRGRRGRAVRVRARHAPFAQITGLMHEAAHRCCSRQAAQRLRRAMAARLPDLHVDRRLPARAHGAPPRGVRTGRARHGAVPRLPDHRLEPSAEDDPRRDRKDGWKLLPRPAPRRPISRRPASANTAIKILAVQAVLVGRRSPPVHWCCTRSSWLRPVPHVMAGREPPSRSIAEHGGDDSVARPSRATRSGRQSPGRPVFMSRTTSAWHPRAPRRLRRPGPPPPPLHAASVTPATWTTRSSTRATEPCGGGCAVDG